MNRIKFSVFMNPKSFYPKGYMCHKWEKCHCKICREYRKSKKTPARGGKAFKPNKYQEKLVKDIEAGKRMVIEGRPRNG